MENSEKLSAKELFQQGVKNLNNEGETKKYDFSKRIDRSEEVQNFRTKSLEKYGNTEGDENEALKEVINEMCDDLEYKIKRSDEFYNNASELVQEMVNLQNITEKDSELDEGVKLRQEKNKRVMDILNIHALDSSQSDSFNSLQKDAIGLAENKEFLEDLVVMISGLHTIEEWIEITNPKEKPEIWFKKLDEKLEEIEIREDFSEYIVEMEKLRELLQNSFNMIKWIPIILKCSQCSSCYYLELLRYGGFERLSEYLDMVKVGDGEKPHMLVTLLDKIVFTIYYMSMNIILNRGANTQLEWGTKEENEKKLSKQAFMEYNDYLLENGVFDSQSFGGCTIL